MANAVASTMEDAMESTMELTTALSMAPSVDDAMDDAMVDATDDAIDGSIDDATEPSTVYFIGDDMDTRSVETRHGRRHGIVHRRTIRVVRRRFHGHTPWTIPSCHYITMFPRSVCHSEKTSPMSFFLVNTLDSLARWPGLPLIKCIAAYHGV